MRRAAADFGRIGRMLGRPSFSVALGALALLLFCWPFVHHPPLPLARAYIHLFGAWVLVIAVLGLVSRRLPEDAGEDVARDEDA